MPSVTVREYHSESGALLSNINTLSFGRVTSGMHSRVKVLDLAFNEVTYTGNIKLGLISSGGLTVNTNPQDLASDGSSGNGFFGIEYSQVFDSSKSSQPLARHFSGLNTTISASDVHNVSIGNRSSVLSDFIYIDLQVGTANVVAGNGAYKVFFDYS
jgi:hypothetical protein